MKQIRVAMIGASLEQNGGIATVEKLIFKYAFSNIQVQHITSHDEGSATHRIVVFGKALLKFFWKLLLRRVDVAHIHLSDGGSVLRKTILSLLAYGFHKPVLIHAHGAEFDLKNSKFPKWLQEGTNLIFRQCKGFIVLSETWKEYYVSNMRLDEKQVFVLPNPVELATQVPARTSNTTIKIVFFGRIGQRKGAFDLVNAFASLAVDRRKNVQLFLAGDGEIQHGLELVDRLGLKDSVTFLGWVDSEQRDQLLAAAHIFALPSYNEGLPMALLEAMGWGLPVIATPVGGIPELITSGVNGLLVNPGDIQQLSAVIQSLIQDEILRSSLGRAARESVMPFNIEGYCHSLDKIYHLMCKS
jgi:glycosyltransferase involved in cell wall biosynthesis